MSDWYFQNDEIEVLMTRYVQGGCVDRALRDELLLHAVPLTRNVIIAKGLHQLMHPRNDETVEELMQVALMQIEKTMYKYEPGRGRLFSMWTQITYLSVMAYIKKETNDYSSMLKFEKAGTVPQHARSPEAPEPQDDFYAVLRELREAVSDDQQQVDMVMFIEDWHRKTKNPSFGVIAALKGRFGRIATKRFLERVRALEI